jgi:homocysteine S-methyltransferase
MRDFEAALMKEDSILAEGAVIEPLRRRGSLLDEHLLAAPLVLEEEGRQFLGEIYRSYIDVAVEAGLSIVILAPTWKAGTGQCEKAGLDMATVNSACVGFMRELASGYPGMEERIFIGGIVGSRGDAYRPGEALPRGEAERYHAPQLELLSGSGVDFVMASTIPSVEEGSGIAMAAAGAGAPLVMSYVARSDGKVLDGTFLGDFARALGRDENAPLVSSGRLIGLQANASMLAPDELDGREELDADDPIRWAGAMAALRKAYGIKLLGGCCGTDERYLRRLAQFLAARR